MSDDNLHVSTDRAEMPVSILDTDLYKLTMQNAVLRWFPDAWVKIRFTNRSPQMLFTRQSFDWIQERVNRLHELRLTSDERSALERMCPYFPAHYLDFLSSIKLSPKEQVKLEFIPKAGDKGEIGCLIEGLWRETILYEVPLLAIFSEGYFLHTDTDWNLDGVKENAKKKCLELLRPPPPVTSLSLSEFGTRRRRSFHIHDLVMQGLIEGHEEWKREGGGPSGGLAGTSNVYFALRYNVKPVGTIAHEWIMAIGSVYGYKGCNGRAMDMWEAVYPRGENEAPLTMLTDTYTAHAFFLDFVQDPARAERWTSLRQDSGDPMAFVREAKDSWRRLEEGAGKVGADGKVAQGKRVVFSDSLDVERAIALQQGCDELGIAASFGIGTHLTNDFRKASDPSAKSEPLNIVIKLNEIDGRACVKLSDDKGKYTGSVDEVKKVQDELHLDADHTGKSRG